MFVRVTASHNWRIFKTHSVEIRRDAWNAKQYLWCIVWCCL